MNIRGYVIHVQLGLRQKLARFMENFTVCPFKFRTAAGAILATCLLPVLSGCGGGASEKPTVTVKPAKSESAGGGSTAAETKAGGGEASGSGTLTGKVVFDGTPPSLPFIHRKGDQIKDAAVCAAVDTPNEKLVIGPGNGVANVFIYLQRAPAGKSKTPPPSEPLIFDQKNCRFHPHALFVQTGQTVRVISSDPISHNTKINPQFNPPFNQVLQPNDQTGADLVYQRAEPEPVQVQCNIHNWMIAYHLPLDHPYGAVTAEDGTFKIEHLPAGTHRFRVWHESAVDHYLNRSLSVTIKPNETTNLEIKYPADKYALHAQPAVKSVKLSALLQR